MASSSGTSSGSSQLQNSGSEENRQQIMDQRKRKRMVSNRESARRSRVRKQKHMDDLRDEVGQLRNQNNHILTNMNMITNQVYLNIEAENSVLRAQLAELTHRLQSLNEIIHCFNSNNNDFFETEAAQMISSDNDFLNPWNLLSVNQPIMASANIFMC
uniref:Putative ocs element-binding factor 1-like n=1 Tax=Davidia involucrata TaxID=16924 RepID=A0A5B7B6P6_DAVIN